MSNRKRPLLILTLTSIIWCSLKGPDLRSSCFKDHRPYHYIVLCTWAPLWISARDINHLECWLNEMSVRCDCAFLLHVIQQLRKSQITAKLHLHSTHHPKKPSKTPSLSVGVLWKPENIHLQKTTTHKENVSLWLVWTNLATREFIFLKKRDNATVFCRNYVKLQKIKAMKQAHSLVFCQARIMHRLWLLMQPQVNAGYFHPTGIMPASLKHHKIFRAPIPGSTPSKGCLPMSTGCTQHPFRWKHDLYTATRLLHWFHIISGIWLLTI